MTAREWNPATKRLQRMVPRRGFAPGTAPGRTSNLAFMLLVTLALGAASLGTITIANEVREIVGSR